MCKKEASGTRGLEEACGEVKAKRALELIRAIGVELSLLTIQLGPALVSEATAKPEVEGGPKCEIVEKLEVLYGKMVMLNSRVKL